MKVYGFDDVGVPRGEMLASTTEAFMVSYGMDTVAAELDWEFASTSFAAAKAELIKRMIAEEINVDMIMDVRILRAPDVPMV